MLLLFRGILILLAGCIAFCAKQDAKQVLAGGHRLSDERFWVPHPFGFAYKGAGFDFLFLTSNLQSLTSSIEACRVTLLQHRLAGEATIAARVASRSE